MHLKYLIIFFTILTQILCQRPNVTIQDGELIGIPMQTWMGRNISAFLGIPFAAPPVGPLRFQPPQPVTPWTWPRDAGTPGNQCSQLPFGGPQYFPDNPVGYEDCLYLNVYTPTLPNPQINQPLLPVLVYFHGGSFMAFNGSSWGPRYLLDHNMLLVTTNYRLGVLGFLYSGDSASPGNMGLKDQVVVLRWINKNIAAFGGDPTQVTLSGTSPGAISALYHFMSPLSRGLFQRAICQSGSPLEPYAEMKQPMNKFNTFAKIFNCTSPNTTVVVQCLQRITDYSLVYAQRIYQGFNSNPTDIFGPTVERSTPSSFLTQLPYESMRTGNYANLPIIMTTVLNEGLIPSINFITNATSLAYVNSNWNTVAPYLLDYSASVDSRLMNGVSQKIRNQYFGNQTISTRNVPAMVQLVGDRQYNNDIENGARILAYTNNAPVYFSRFAYRGSVTLTTVLTGTNVNYGVAHGDDVYYVFNTSGISAETTPRDRQMISIVSGLWANFTIYGTPSGNGIQWTPIDRNTALDGPFNYLLLASPTMVRMQSAITFGNLPFWNSLPINEPWAGRPVNTMI